jgi:YbbR domain-containing protein
MRLIKELLLENWGLKLTAIFLAFFLWLVVRGDPSGERIISVSLEIRLARNMEITSERPNTVDVTVRGAFSNLWFSTSIPTYVIDLQTYDEGEHVILLSPQNVRFPRASGLEPIAVRPARLKIKLERTAIKEVPIKVATRGEPGPGIDIYEIAAKPPTAILSGPRSGVEPLREVPTEPITLTAQRQSIRRFVNLDIRDDAIHSTPAGPIEVNIQLGPHRRMEKVLRVPVMVDDKVFTVSPRWVTVGVLVPITYDKAPAAADFLATVAIPNLGPNETIVKLKPQVRLRNPTDPAIVVKEVQPAEVEVRRVKKN